MNKHRDHFRWPRPSSGRRWVWLAAAVLIWGCGGQYPYFTPSQRVTDLFESGIPPDGYRFFITGSPYRPEALFGVVPELAPPAGGPWRAVPEDPALWRQLVHGMLFFDEKAITPGIYGALLMLPDGRPVGVWYSARGRGTVRLDDAGRLWVWPPRERQALMLRRDF